MTPIEVEELLREAKVNLENARRTHDECLLAVAKLEAIKAIIFVETGIGHIR